MSKKYEARISMLVQSHLTTLIETQLNDPRVKGVTVTEVEVTADTRFARVYFSVLGSADDKDKATRGLDSASGWLSKELGRRLRTKHTPHITFKYDESLERGERMAQLLDEVKAKETAMAATTASLVNSEAVATATSENPAEDAPTVSLDTPSQESASPE